MLGTAFEGRAAVPDSLRGRAGHRRGAVFARIPPCSGCGRRRQATGHSASVPREDKSAPPPCSVCYSISKMRTLDVILQGRCVRIPAALLQTAPHSQIGRSPQVKRSVSVSAMAGRDRPRPPLHVAATVEDANPVIGQNSPTSSASHFQNQRSSKYSVIKPMTTMDKLVPNHGPCCQIHTIHETITRIWNFVGPTQVYLYA